MVDDAPLEQGAAYQSLYRRFRPQRFSELRGQEHVALALRHAVRDERVGHAYLFSGPRGTGKTSAARILAKALNCAAPEEGEPCGRCDSCRSITEGSSFDVHELDAASNNGVDAMRDLVARAALATPGNWKVYIVDEVHMLSVAASNALLKTLEEPPGHVVFVLATTDAHKVLPTIRSRTQHFEFHLLPESTLAELVGDVAAAASLELPDGALESAVRRGRGSARDALSVLDQVAAAGIVEDDTDLVDAVIASIADSDAEGAVVAVDLAMRDGHDPQQLALGLVEQLRAGFLSLAGGAPSPEALAGSALEAASRLGLVRCVRALEVIGAALVAMRESPDARVTLEVALIRLARPEADPSPEALLERVERLERRLAELASGAPTQAAPARPQPAAPAQQASPEASETTAASAGPVQGRPTLGAFRRPPEASAPAPAEEERQAEPAPAPTPTLSSAKETPPTRDELVLAWGDHVVTQLKGKARAIFGIAHFVGTDGDVGLLAVPSEAHLAMAAPLTGEVERALSAHFGRPVRIRLVTEQGVEVAPAPRTIGSPAVAAARVEDDEPFGELDDEGAPAPGEPVGIAAARDRLLQAFPGTQELEAT